MAIKLDPNNWYRLEGYILPTTDYQYGSYISSLSGIDIWYTNVEVQLQNPDNVNYIHGVNYKTRTFEEYGYATIEQIANNINTVLPQMVSDMSDNEGALTYTSPFVITKSSVIVYDDAYNQNLTKYVIVLKDDYLTAAITSVIAVYDGPPSPIGVSFDYQYLTVTGIFDDGHQSEFGQLNYTITRVSDGTHTSYLDKVGENIFIATASYGDNSWEARFTVIGIKNITSITATYSGPRIAINKSPLKRDFIVCANYTDGSASTVTDWSFYNGGTITETNKGTLTIYYMGCTCNVNVNYYTTNPTQIKAFYNGPSIEKGSDFDLNDLTVKIYHQSTDSSNSYWETLSAGTYTVNSMAVPLEGDNIITVNYVSNNGDTFTTTFLITGFVPEAYIAYIEAEYSGPPVTVGKSYNQNKVTVNVYWSNGDISSTKNFMVNATQILVAGDNTYTASYSQKTCTFIVPGIAEQDTNETNYNPTQIDLKYPEANKLNHRYRGPMESSKFTEYNSFIYDNITKLFDIYNELEDIYNTISKSTNSLYNTGVNTINTCAIMDERLRIINNKIMKGGNNN